MADTNIKVLTPAANFALLTVEELKVMLGIDVADVSNDEQLQQMIDWHSSSVSLIADRVFAREKVRETWRGMGSRRIYLSHWPVKEADIESVEAPRGTPTVDYELEEKSGKLSLFGATSEPVVVTYTGGFNLPDDAPGDLKNAAAILIRQGRAAAQRDATSGVRMIAHKDSRIMYHDPNRATTSSAADIGGGADANRAVRALLYRYSRLEV